jgi:SAM-dependent methyltransferase
VQPSLRNGKREETNMTATNPPDDDQKALWNGVAGHAWVDAQETLDAVLRPFEELLLDSVAAESGRHLLDVGCGTGSTTLAFARKLGANGHCLGIDISEPMLACARARAERERSSATFVCADAEDYAFEPASFDVILSRFGVMFFADPVRAFVNLRRAAKRDAELRFVAWRSPAENPFMTVAERAAAPLLPDAPPRRPDGPGQFSFADDRLVHRILAETGWSEIDIRPLDVECAMPEPALVGYVSRLGPLGRVLASIEDPMRTRILEVVRAAFDPYVHGAEVRFTAACWDARAVAR